MGFVSFNVMVHVVGAAVSGEIFGVKPEKNPGSKGWHGLANDDCVTEWF
jgi:hypothetical protein